MTFRSANDGDFTDCETAEPALNAPPKQRGITLCDQSILDTPNVAVFSSFLSKIRPFLGENFDLEVTCFNMLPPASPPLPPTDGPQGSMLYSTYDRRDLGPY